MIHTDGRPTICSPATHVAPPGRGARCWEADCGGYCGYPLTPLDTRNCDGYLGLAEPSATQPLPPPAASGACCGDPGDCGSCGA